MNVRTPASRRQEYKAATRRALVQSAVRLFSTRGFAETTLNDVATRARVTKGAVYHHFESKEALFLAALELVDERTVVEIAAATEGTRSAWTAAIAALDAFLERCLDPTYRKICFEEGPQAIGFVAWWEHGERHVEGMLKAALISLRDAGDIVVRDVDAMSATLYGSLTAGALAIARADKPEAAKTAVRATLLQLLEGLRP
ncbi:MAG: TetR family transcriptional regulator [Actinobacteria bacterium]|nr:TetR family transcriptional regulator [Actinomycetota bacterium]MBV9253006.1 TetR family transcriptional regulator [Actinomycetota bacterium]